MADWSIKGFDKVSGVVGATKKQASEFAEATKKQKQEISEAARKRTADLSESARASKAEFAEATRKRKADLSEATKRASQGLSEQASKVSGAVSKAVEDYTPDIVRDAGGRVSERIDILTGNALLDMVQDMVSLQEQYNDVLAAKLEEALTRIEILEAALAKKEGAA